MRMILIAAAAVVLASILVGIGYQAGADSVTARQASLSELIAETARAVELRTAERIAAIRVVNQTIQGKVREVVHENTVYRDCVIDPATVRLLDAAREGRSIEPASSGGGMSAALTSPAP
jgi:hypothetical protein